MSMQSINSQVLSLRSSGAFHSDERLAIIEVNGQDSARFLQARLSNDVNALSPGQGQRTCLLDRKAYILDCALLYRRQDGYWLLAAAERAAELLKQLEEFKFRENVSFRLLSDAKFFCVDGTTCDLFLLKTTPADEKHPAEDHSIFDTQVCSTQCTVVRRNNTGEPGLVIVYGSGLSPAGAMAAPEAEFIKAAEALNMVPVSEEAYKIACLENGQLGLDLHGVPLAETGLESIAVSYTKGCFPGQEVLARIRTYGAPKRGVIGLIFDDKTKQGDAQKLQSGAAIVHNGAEIGSLYSAGFSPTQNMYVAIAFVDREFRVPGMSLEVSIEKNNFNVTSTSLPFYGAQDKLKRAEELYQAALQEFTKGSEQSAITMLRDVIRMNPTMGDAYEVLGVILSKHDQLDDAIAMTKQLAQLDPNSIMAHANLSVYYMQKGDKEAAEEEKAIAMSIRMSQIARSAAAEQQEAEQRKKLKEAAQDRMNMFRQVLAIDADDFLANAGLGSVYVDMEQYDEAVPYLEKALSIRPNHTVAYVALGEAFEKLGNTARALETYKKGIAVASQRGDGEPMKKMQIRLLKLGAGASK